MTNTTEQRPRRQRPVLLYIVLALTAGRGRISMMSLDAAGVAGATTAAW